MLFVLDPWSSAPVVYSPIRLKSRIFNIGHDYALWNRDFMVMMKKPKNLDFETWSNGKGHKSIKIPKFKYKARWYSIERKFHADDKKSFCTCSAAGNLLKTIKCAPFFHGNTQFPIYLNFSKVFFSKNMPQNRGVFLKNVQVHE
jgi:hypothetical protein